jgi:hypothetical protein
MTSRKITVRGIFNEAGELIRILHQNGGGKYYFMDVEPSKDGSIDEFFMEMMPPQQPIEKLDPDQLPPGVIPEGGQHV